MIAFVSTFSSFSLIMNKILKVNFNRLLSGSGHLSNFKIISAHRKNKNLQDLLVRAKLPLLDSDPKLKKMSKSNNCFQHLTFVRNPVSQTLLRISRRIRPTDRNCIYLLRCDTCGKQYVGETRNSILSRLWQHRYNARHNRELNTALMQHIMLHGWTSIRVTGLQCNPNWSNKERKATERRWIYLLNSTEPHGLNQQFRTSL